MDLIVTVTDDRVNFVKKLLRELNLPYKVARTASARAKSEAKPRQVKPSGQR